MLGMDMVYVIRHKVLKEGRSVRSVARELGLSRNTVKKYLGVAEPRRHESAPRQQPVTKAVAPRIEEILEEWSGRTTARQRLTATRVHQQLVEEGRRVGITTVRDYMREKRRRQAEVFIPLVHRPGEEGQVDFFQVTVEEAGALREVWKFLLRLPYSGRDFAWLYDRCDQLAFLDGHTRGAAYLGGLPQRIVYDNLTAAVKRLVGVERELTERFKALVSHYLFEPCFARPGEGHDKGSVESRGKGLRLKYLTPIPRGEALSQISEAVLKAMEDGWRSQVRRDGKGPEALWEEERRGLLPLPARPFEARRTVLTTVSSKATVQVEKGLYSVPSTWARLDVAAHVGVEDIRLSCRDEELVVRRERPGGKKIQYRHYLPELSRKPQAVRQVAPELVAEMGEPFQKLWRMLEARYGSREAARVMARVLGAVVDHGEGAVAEALETAFEAGRQDLLALPRRQDGPRAVAVPVALQGYEVEAASASDYDALLIGGRR